jgi:cytochrome c
MRKRFATLLVMLSLLAGHAGASDALATRYTCVACHHAERKVLGPSWKDVAAKYADGRKTVDELAESIRKGSTGQWGAVAMPAQPRVSSAEARALAEWVLARPAGTP